MQYWVDFADELGEIIAETKYMESLGFQVRLDLATISFHQKFLFSFASMSKLLRVCGMIKVSIA